MEGERFAENFDSFLAGLDKGGCSFIDFVYFIDQFLFEEITNDGDILHIQEEWNSTQREVFTQQLPIQKPRA